MREPEKIWREGPAPVAEIERRWGIARTRLTELVESVAGREDLYARLGKAAAGTPEHALLLAYRNFQSRFKNWDYAKVVIQDFLKNFKNNSITLLDHALALHTSQERKTGGTVAAGLKNLAQALIALVHHSEYWTD